MKKIVIDLLGSDNSEEELLKGVFLAKRETPSYSFVLSGKKESIVSEVLKNDFLEGDFSYLDTDVALTNYDNPKDIIKKDNVSSLALAIDHLKSDDESIGIISSGSTGALLLGSIFRLGLIDGIKIPLLGSRLHSFTGKPLILLDCGANLSFESTTYLKAASLGSALAKSSGCANPRIGLLNVGKEKGKGNEALKEAYSLLESKSSLTFMGNIEGNDIFSDRCDVILCDGYTGNVVLKLAESMGMYASKKLADLETSKAKESSENAFNDFAYTELGASILLGPKKICLKCHGKVSSLGIKNTINQLIELYEGSLICKLQETITK